MNKIKIQNGGPVHPISWVDNSTGVKITVPGMSLRAYAAIHADLSKNEFGDIETLAAFLGCEVPDGDEFSVLFDLDTKANAKLRVAYADALIAELLSKPDPTPTDIASGEIGGRE